MQIQFFRAITRSMMNKTSKSRREAALQSASKSTKETSNQALLDKIAALKAEGHEFTPVDPEKLKKTLDKVEEIAKESSVYGA